MLQHRAEHVATGPLIVITAHWTMPSVEVSEMINELRPIIDLKEDSVRVGFCETCAERGRPNEPVYKIGMCTFCYHGLAHPRATSEQLKRESKGLAPARIPKKYCSSSLDGNSSGTTTGRWENGSCMESCGDSQLLP